MRKMDDKTRRRLKRKASIRKRVSGTAERPRLSVYKSNRHTYVQAIDDATGRAAAALVVSRGAEFVDVNLGCPIDYFTSKGLGATLGRQPKRIQRIIEVFADIFRQETQDEVSVLLQQSILPPVAPVGLGVRQVLGAVQFE